MRPSSSQLHVSKIWIEARSAVLSGCTLRNKTHLAALIGSNYVDVQALARNLLVIVFGSMTLLLEFTAWAFGLPRTSS